MFKELKDIILIAVLLISSLIVFDKFLRISKLVKREQLFKKRKESGEMYQILAKKCESIVNNVPKVIFHIDSTGKLLYINQPWIKLTGFQLEESLGKRLPDFFLLEERQGLSSQIHSKMLSGELI